MKVTKAVFPVAGLGTRFLPATKASPKEMLPIVDKPLIQYAVEEAVDAGITELVFVTGRNKNSITDHFDKAYELENELSGRGKTDLLKIVQNIVPPHITCVYIRQAEALGLGHAVLCAKQVVGMEPFAVLLADDLMRGTPGVVKQMVDVFNKQKLSLIGVEPVLPEDTSKYGIVDAAVDNGDVFKIKGIVEKPDPGDAPSNMGVIGRYILTPRIFGLLESITPGAGGEIQLTDAIASMLDYEVVQAYRFKGKRYDCGSKLGYLQATVEYGLDHPEIGNEFSDYLKKIIK